MFPVQRGLYGHRSTMSQFAKPGYSFMAFDPFPFTNANLTDFSVPNKSPLMQYPSSTDELYDQEISKESSNNSLPPKKPLTKAERRAEHNAIERARRENLNSKFQSLAQALPNLINYRRPSKSQIVEKAFDWVKQSISREERYRYQILQLQRENKRLLAQLMHYQHQQQQPEEGGHAKYPMANNPIPTICTPHASTTTTTIMSTSPPASIPMYSNLNPPTPPPQSLTFTATSTTTLSTSASPTYAPVNSSMNANTNNNGWSTNPYLMNPTLQMNHYNNNTEDITKQDFANSKSDDDDDNTSSGNEDDTDYQSSPNASYLENRSPQKQYEKVNQKNLLVNEIYPVGGEGNFQSTDTPFDSPILLNNWNQSGRYSSHLINSGNFDPGLNNRSTPAQMLS